jgi:hypothetical protein
MKASKRVIVALLALLTVAAALYGIGQARWSRLTRELIDGLEAANDATASPRRFEEWQLATLPPVVQRYFRAAIAPDAPMLAAVTVEHSGSFNMGEATDNWKPFTSRQRVVLRRPGFVWNGRVAFMPGVPVHVHDAYVAGVGVLHPAVLGLISLTQVRGEGAIAEGELMRLLAEAPWYPTALLPSEGVHWEPVDEHAAKATLRDDAVSVTLTFQFGSNGLVQSVRAEARGRMVGGQILMRPWEGRYSDPAVREGMTIPMRGEVAWLLPEAEGGRKPYWRGTIRNLSYEVRP